MENCIQQETHHDDRFIFAKFVNEEACKRGRECESERVRERGVTARLYLQLQLQLLLLWPGQSVALSAAALSNKLSTTRKRERGGGVSPVNRVGEIRKKTV